MAKEVNWNNFQQDIQDRRSNIEKAWKDNVQKAEKDLLHLIKKKVLVTRGGKTFLQTVYISPETGEIIDNPVGSEISPEFNKMKISKYSDQAMIITGETFSNLSLLQSIKKELGVGAWNSKLRGWIFPISSTDKVLGQLYSNVNANELLSDESEVKEDILVLKNAYKIGTKIQGNSQNGEIIDFHIENDQVLYDIKTEDGKIYTSIKESLIKILPETDNKKIAELIQSAEPENRNTIELQINGSTDKPKEIEEVVKEECKKSIPESKLIDSGYKPKKTTINIQDKNLEVDDYTDIPVIQILLPKDKNILDKSKPSYIPSIDEDKFLRNYCFFDCYKLDEDKYLVALNGYKRDDPTGLSVMSLDLLTATIRYYRSKKTAENKKKYEDLGRKSKRLSFVTERKSTYSQINLFQDLNPFVKLDYYKKPFWESYRNTLNNFKQKIMDMELQMEDLENAHAKGEETSFGNIGLRDDLLKDYGVRVKRQNGSEIKKDEINQIKECLDIVYSVFGNRSEMSKNWGLKISHSGEKLIHARKAAGLFFPHYNAIGVSFADKEFSGFVLSHEFGHFMDYWVGKRNEHHYASDKEGSVANDIARTFRRSCNNLSNSAYWSRTCENFARANEQYSAYKLDKGQYESYTKNPNYVSKEKFETQIVPLIEKFFKENNEFLKSVNINIIK